MGAYIINIPDSVDRVVYTNVDPMNGKTYLASYSVDDLTPYTEPDLEQIKADWYKAGREAEKVRQPDIEQVRKEAYEKGYENGFVAGHLKAEKSGQSFYEDGYQKGLSDAWEAARKIVLDTDKGGIPLSKLQQVFHKGLPNEIIGAFSASEALEEIRAYEQAQKEKEEQEEKDFVTTEEVMRQYLDTFCKRNFCTKCILHIPDFTCGRGYHFLTSSPVSDEEVRRAYAAVLAKLKE